MLIPRSDMHTGTEIFLSDCDVTEKPDNQCENEMVEPYVRRSLQVVFPVLARDSVLTNFRFSAC